MRCRRHQRSLEVCRDWQKYISFLSNPHSLFSSDTKPHKVSARQRKLQRLSNLCHSSNISCLARSHAKVDSGAFFRSWLAFIVDLIFWRFIPSGNLRIWFSNVGLIGLLFVSLALHGEVLRARLERLRNHKWLKVLPRAVQQSLPRNALRHVLFLRIKER